MFKCFYNKARFNYINSQIEDSPLFEYSGRELLPKTACFFSDDLDVYIDTSDGVNEDLQIQEYCGRILSCIRASSGKRFLFFKAAHSKVWSKNIEVLAEENNGRVLPFFKWSFNDNFYRYTLPNLTEIRNKKVDKKHDIGLFADFSKKYQYPKPSTSDARISWSDHSKFNLDGSSANNGDYEIRSRPNVLSKVEKSKFSVFAGTLPYTQYLEVSAECNTVLNPPGIGEYTSRMMDQTAIGNVIVLRSNSYDNGNSWKDYIPEIDFGNPTWEHDYQKILDDLDHWREKGLYYYEKKWSPSAVFNYFIDAVRKEL